MIYEMLIIYVSMLREGVSAHTSIGDFFHAPKLILILWP